MTGYFSESREDITEQVEVMDGNIEVAKNTTRSKIKLIPTSEDDGKIFTCEARHPALAPPTVGKKVNVQLSVQCT